MIALIDNYDSFTMNLVHYLTELGAAVSVFRNDQTSAEELLNLDCAGLVLSPGPGGPADAGICLDLVAQAPEHMPILGVCLGHQVIATALGGTVVRSARPVHGKPVPVRHEGRGLFAGLPSTFTAVRYNSLTVDACTLPAALRAVAWDEGDDMMALEHCQRPLYGVQFHPESVGSEQGYALLANFLKATGR